MKKKIRYCNDCGTPLVLPSEKVEGLCFYCHDRKYPKPNPDDILPF